MRIVKYIAAISAHDANVRSQGIDTRLNIDEADKMAVRLTSQDCCQPKCQYRVYEIVTEILPWQG